MGRGHQLSHSGPTRSHNLKEDWVQPGRNHKLSGATRLSEGNYELLFDSMLEHCLAWSCASNHNWKCYIQYFWRRIYHQIMKFQWQITPLLSTTFQTENSHFINTMNRKKHFSTNKCQHKTLIVSLVFLLIWGIGISKKFLLKISLKNIDNVSSCLKSIWQANFS